MEFLRYLSGEISAGELLSPLEDHEIPVRMLSAAYESHVNSITGKNPIVIKSMLPGS